MTQHSRSTDITPTKSWPKRASFSNDGDEEKDGQRDKDGGQNQTPEKEQTPPE